MFKIKLLSPQPIVKVLIKKKSVILRTRPNQQSELEEQVEKKSQNIVKVTEDVPLPSDMECFWPSELNKIQLQSFARSHVAEKILQNYNVIVSGVITDSDIFPTERFEAGRNNVTEIGYLKAAIEEADDKIPRHTAYEIKSGSKRILVISNDSYSSSLFHEGI